MRFRVLLILHYAVFSKNTNFFANITLNKEITVMIVSTFSHAQRKRKGSGKGSLFDGQNRGLYMSYLRGIFGISSG